MKYLFLADLHLTGTDRKHISIDGIRYPQKLYYKTKCIIDAIEKFQKDNDEGIIIFAGDIFHEKRYMYGLALLSFIDILNTIKFPTYILAGNHDTEYKNDVSISLLSWISGDDNYNDLITVIEPNQYHILNDMVLLSWSPNLQTQFQNLFDNNIIGDKKILVSHFGITEAELSNGFYTKGDFKLKDLKQYFDLIILGHYHKPQNLEMDNCKLYYIGSVIQENWGEKGEKKRYLIYDDEKNIIESYEFEGYPKYQELATDNIKDIKNFIDNINDNDYYRISVKSKEVLDYCKENNIPFVINKNAKIFDEIDNDNTNIRLLNEKDLYVSYLETQGIKDSKKQKKYIEVLNTIINSE